MTRYIQAMALTISLIFTSSYGLGTAAILKDHMVTQMRNHTGRILLSSNLSYNGLPITLLNKKYAHNWIDTRTHYKLPIKLYGVKVYQTDIDKIYGSYTILVKLVSTNAGEIYLRYSYKTEPPSPELVSDPNALYNILDNSPVSSPHQ